MKAWKWLLLLVIGAAGIGGVALYSHFERLYRATDNAYIDATAIHVSSQIDGPVTRVPVNSLETVARGDVLFEIDTTPYRSELAAARARLALAQRQVQENRAELATAEATVRDARIHLENAGDQLRRLENLKEKSYSSIQQTDDAEALYRRARAQLEVSEARLEKARVRLTPNEAGEDLLVAEARANLEHARWALSQTTVKAPCDGILESVDINPGETVRAHNSLMLLVCTNRYWINANFKETQLERIRPGQPVEIEVDMYPDHVFRGVVQSISPASGTAFSLLPPENATGNWVKTTQRIPVRIHVLDRDEDYPLRVGASTQVRIDTTRQSNPS